MNIEVLGGTFDPVHNGHMAVAEEVRTRLELAEVLFLPAGQPWLKPEYGISAAEDRVEMLRLALAYKRHFKLSLMEIERPGPTYTVDTIAELRKQHGDSDEIYFIMGWDSLAELPMWKEPSRLISLCRLVAVPRPGYSLPDLKSQEKTIPGLSGRVILLDKPVVDISATVIRSRVALGLSIRDFVSGAVERYIREHRLYVK